MRRHRVLVAGRGEQKLAPYLAAIEAAGLTAVPVQPGGVARLESGLVLTGGSDIDPQHYGQPPDPQLGEVDRERDAFELDLLGCTEQDGPPILAICRGLQLLNVHRGGTLIQHLPQSDRHRRRDTPPSQPVHPVTVEAGSRLASIAGADRLQVNSRHHQAVDRLGSGLIVAARDSEDGTIEALEDPTRRFLLAVQWHPEDQAPSDPLQARIFAAFAASVLSLRVVE